MGPHKQWSFNADAGRRSSNSSGAPTFSQLLGVEPFWATAMLLVMQYMGRGAGRSALLSSCKSCHRFNDAIVSGGVAGPLGWSTVLTHKRVAISLLSVVDVSTYIVTFQDEQEVVETELSRFANTCKRMQEYWYGPILGGRSP